MNFQQHITEDRRLVILRGLQAADQYKAPAILLRTYCNTLGHTVSGDVMETDLAWLQEQGLVRLAKAEGITVATLTARGADVASGAAVVPGVKRPEPGL